METKRVAGILLPIFSLPGNYGIGDFGKDAFKFIDMLSESGNKIWQILPLNPLGYGNSPYQPLSSNAGDEIFIDLEQLFKDGLIKELPHNISTKTINYENVREIKNKYLKEAYSNFSNQVEIEEFKNNNPWVLDFANFISRTKKDGYWQEWLDKSDFSYKYPKEIEYEIFIQYIFYKQWMKIKNYANAKGISIMGDIPIYVGINSVDVWMNKENFILDKDAKPTHIAGVPPDYFSTYGQRWGNPLYDWDYMRKYNYDFFVNRVKDNVKLYDIIRIDHFRALDTYYVIESKYEDARIGEWKEAPGYEILDALYNEISDLKIVAEDLGDLRPQVLELRDHFKLAGMKIVEFTFDPRETNNDFDDRENMIIYTGTHDNQTILGWYNDQSKKNKSCIKAYFKKHRFTGSIKERFLDYTLSSIANTAIVPFQDYLGFDDITRINTPGTVGSPNWEFKLENFDGFDIDFVKKLVVKNKRY